MLEFLNKEELYMKPEDFLTLAKAGFNATQITAIMALQNAAAPAAPATAAPAPAAPAAPAPAQAPAAAPPSRAPAHSSGRFRPAPT